MISDERIERAARAIFRGLLPRGRVAENEYDHLWHDKHDERNEALYHARAALAADAPEIAAAEIRGLEMAKEIALERRAGYVRLNSRPDLSKAGRDSSHGSSSCAAQIADDILARIAELKAKTKPVK